MEQILWRLAWHALRGRRRLQRRRELPLHVQSEYPAVAEIS